MFGKTLRLTTWRRWAVAAATALAVGLGTSVGAQPAAASTCAITIYGKTGQYICGTNVPELDWTTYNGKYYRRWWVIGTNHAVWTILVQTVNGSAVYNSGWTSIGGYANDGVWATKTPQVNSPYEWTAKVVGSDSQLWCRRMHDGWGSPYLDSWQRCS